MVESDILLARRPASSVAVVQYRRRRKGGDCVFAEPTDELLDLHEGQRHL
jgi:hypothetical protein